MKKVNDKTWFIKLVGSSVEKQYKTLSGLMRFAPCDGRVYMVGSIYNHRMYFYIKNGRKIS